MRSSAPRRRGMLRALTDKSRRVHTMRTKQLPTDLRILNDHNRTSSSELTHRGGGSRSARNWSELGDDQTVEHHDHRAHHAVHTRL